MKPDDEEFAAWAERVQAHVLPAIQTSAATVSLVPDGETDIKFAVELGLSIMLDKPLIMVVQPGTKVPDKIVRVADRIIEADLTSPGGSEYVARAVQQAMNELDAEGKLGE